MPSPSPPAQKKGEGAEEARDTAARQGQAGQASTGDGAGNRTHAATDTRDSVVETEP